MTDLLNARGATPRNVVKPPEKTGMPIEVIDCLSRTLPDLPLAAIKAKR